MPVLKVRDPNTGQYVPLLGGGVTDHGALTGLADDDHPQYVKDTGDTMTGPLSLKYQTPYFYLDTDPASTGSLVFRRVGVDRWILRTNTANETATDGEGSDLEIVSRNNGGSLRDIPLKINRLTGEVQVLGDPTTVNGVANKGYVDNRLDPGSTYGYAGASGWTAYGGGYSDLLMTRIGNITIIQGVLKRASNLAVTAGSVYQVATIGSAAWRPPQNYMSLSGLEMSPSSTVAWVYVNSDGTIKFMSLASGTVNTGQGMAVTGAWRTN